MENKYNIDGGIGAYSDNGIRAFVQTYTHNEVSIRYIDFDGQSYEKFIRLRIGTNEDRQIIMLSNGKFYMIQGFASEVYWNQELSADYVFGCIDDIIKLNKTIGSLTELQTIEKGNIVKAINELSVRASTSRHIIGYVKYATDGVDPEVEDLSVRYNDINKRFEYYSDVDGWTLLPKGWQRLTNIIRSRDYLPVEPKEGETYGILNEDKVLKYSNGKWLQCLIGDELVGDEYLVQSVYNKLFNGNATGSVIYTTMGWTYLVHYNYL